MRLYQADFNIGTMMHGLDALKALMASDDAKTRKTIGNVIKTAAILSQVSYSSEPFAYYLTPALTACATTAPR